MNRNDITEQWRHCHWKEWREIRNRWNQIRKSVEQPDHQCDRAKTAEFEKRAQVITREQGAIALSG